MEFDESYWSERYEQGNTGWDIGYASPAIVNYFKNIENKEAKILIPGGGNGYEAWALYEMGFKKVYLLDFSSLPLSNFRNKYPSFPENQLLNEDFFHHQGAYDYIVEQTFFCAISPDKRENYLNRMHQILKPGGRLVGLLFNVPLNQDYPPFGGDKAAYERLFSQTFFIKRMEITDESIKPRLGKELFIELLKA